MGQTARDAPQDQLSGRLVAGRYQLGDMLGRGGFGAVYEGHDTRAGEAVAVKVFERIEGRESRARREARTASKLEHPNVHSVLGLEHDDDHSYLVSELVVGERFDRTDLTDEEAVRAIAAVADALAHAHARGVIHRDVKPANILISVDGDVRLTDFGIAKDDDARDQTTADERVLGTLSYMAPEQAQGRKATGATDVWSAALTLYSRLVGENPFKARSLGELLERLGDGIRPLHELRPDLPRELSRVLSRALDHDPDRRPDATRFRDLLLEAIQPPAAEDEPDPSAPRPERTVRRLRIPAVDLDRPLRAAGSILCAGMLVWGLGAFPVYPPAWTLPLAVVVAALAWWRPAAGLALGSALMVPAFWNHAEAAGLAWMALAAAWIWVSRRWPGPRCLSPLAAGPLAVVGLGPAYVLVAASAPTARRRALEGAAGGVVTVVAGGLMTGPAVLGIAGASSPGVLVTALAHSPQAVAVVAAMSGFATLLPLAWQQLGNRRVQATALWGVGFGLAAAALPHMIASRPAGWAPATVAVTLAAIIPAAWALASPRLQYGR
ncbi:MAG: serine/threonine-protein kinase [Gaiellales bacterium]